MNGRRPITITLVAGALLTGCADLVVQDVAVQWDAESRLAEATIANVGSGDAGEFLVYFNGDETPVSPNRLPQDRQTVAELAAGASVTLTADFAPLAHPDNAYLGNVYQITVLADPKGMVDESNEGNNDAVAPIDALLLHDRNDTLVPAEPAPIGQPAQPVLFVHGHQLDSLQPQGAGYRRHWQDPLDYGQLLRLPSFAIALGLQQNEDLGIEPYYIEFQDQHRSITEDAEAIGEAVRRILARHGDPGATQVKVVIIAYSKGTLSTRWYLKHLMPATQPVSEFIALAPPNHGLSGGSALTSGSLAFRQLNNGYDEQCNSFNEPQSADFIENLNGHPIEDTLATVAPGPQFAGEAPGSRADGAPVDQGVLYVTIYADGNRDAVGGHEASGDCQGRVVARNLAPDAVDRRLGLTRIPGLTGPVAHANTVHAPAVICLALYTAVHHAGTPEGLQCTPEPVDGREVPVIPLP